MESFFTQFSTLNLTNTKEFNFGYLAYLILTARLGLLPGMTGIYGTGVAKAQNQIKVIEGKLNLAGDKELLQRWEEIKSEFSFPVITKLNWEKRSVAFASIPGLNTYLTDLYSQVYFNKTNSHFFENFIWQEGEIIENKNNIIFGRTNKIPRDILMVGAVKTSLNNVKNSNLIEKDKNFLLLSEKNTSRVILCCGNTQIKALELLSQPYSKGIPKNVRILGWLKISEGLMALIGNTNKNGKTITCGFLKEERVGKYGLLNIKTEELLQFNPSLDSLRRLASSLLINVGIEKRSPLFVYEDAIEDIRPVSVSIYDWHTGSKKKVYVLDKRPRI